mmetsp:Transcript_5124/g.15065  ORF Transcript_5124/g.15065 Transcript_5124/m.15065 type:complete len:280 (+) Transcript_5124:736-1575(+)
MVAKWLLRKKTASSASAREACLRTANAGGDSASSQAAAASARVGVQLHEPVVRELGGGAVEPLGEQQRLSHRHRVGAAQRGLRWRGEGVRRRWRGRRRGRRRGEPEAELHGLPHLLVLGAVSVRPLRGLRRRRRAARRRDRVCRRERVCPRVGCCSLGRRRRRRVRLGGSVRLCERLDLDDALDQLVVRARADGGGSRGVLRVDEPAVQQPHPQQVEDEQVLRVLQPVHGVKAHVDVEPAAELREERHGVGQIGREVRGRGLRHGIALKHVLGQQRRQL